MSSSYKPPAPDLGAVLAAQITPETLKDATVDFGAKAVLDAQDTADYTEEVVRLPKTEAVASRDRVAEVGDWVFYWMKTDGRNLSKVPAILHTPLPKLPDDPMSGRWKLSVNGLPGMWYSPPPVPYSDEPREGHWTWE